MRLDDIGNYKRDKTASDSPNLAFTVLLIAVVGVLFGVATVVHSGQALPYLTLKEAGRSPMLAGQIPQGH